LLFQAGVDPGVTDLLVMLMEENNFRSQAVISS